MPDQLNTIELDHSPKKNHIWAAAEVHAENLNIEDSRPPHPDRELWYVPTITIHTAHRAKKIFEDNGIRTVYDLGAGDCRFSLWLDREGFDVIAYELNHEIAESVRNRFYLGDMELRQKDYYEDFDQMPGPKTAVVCFGGTNELPYIPNSGVAVQGYGETGIRVWVDGEQTALL